MSTSTLIIGRGARYGPAPLLLVFGLIAFGIAGLSIADMFLPRPYDGVVPESTEKLVIGDVVPGSGAAVAGLKPGDEIRGIGREGVKDARQAQRVLNRFQIGDRIPYLVKTDQGMREIEVKVDRRRLGRGTYLYTTGLGFSFFFLGLFVLVRQPTLRASQVFFLLCVIFLLFFVCRMRPPSYSGIDQLVLGIGTLASIFLPATFLHFFVLFPRPAWLGSLEERPTRRVWWLIWRRGWYLLYVIPPVMWWGSHVATAGAPRLVRGLPTVSWWLLAVYLLLGLLALRANGLLVASSRERRGVKLVFFGSVLGLAPFVISSLLLTISQHSTLFFVFGLMPLLLVPITFTYAIVRFQLLDIQVILRRSLLYTVMTALVTFFYAGGIATFNALSSGTTLASSRAFPVVFALVIVLLFDPLRRRLQDWIDRFFFAGRARLQNAMVELGEAVAAQVDLQAVVEELVERLPQLLGLRFAALYLLRGGRLQRVAGPETLPIELPIIPELQRHLQRRASLTRFDQLGALPLRSPDVAQLVAGLADLDVEAFGELATPRRPIGMVLLSAKIGQIPLERDELDLLRGLLNQASLALETSLLLEERTQRAELERELEIAAGIQARLLPDEVSFAAGWQVGAVCRPARIVGGDFFAELPGENDGAALIFGDVSGKSVSGALMMMAAHEALYALAMIDPEPGRLFHLTNRRLYDLGRRSFVALGYFCACSDGRRLRYLVAGQPAPLLRRADGTVEELPLPIHRIPLGAMPRGDYHALEADLEDGDVVLGYSDGVTDTRSPTGEMYGYERLMDSVARATGGADDLVRQVLEDVERFGAGSLQYDDVTLVAVGRAA